MSDRRAAGSAGTRAAPRVQPAFVLHAYDWSESSLILDLLTREEGRQVAVAKGAKRPYSQLRAVLLPFQCVQVQLSRSKADARADVRADAKADATVDLRAGADDEVRTLRTAEWSPGCPVIASEHLMSSYYLNELLMKFLPRGDAHPALFDAYRHTLAVMSLDRGQGLRAVEPEPSAGHEEKGRSADGGAAPHAGRQTEEDVRVAAAFRAFELLLLHEIGLLPDLAQETLTGAALEPGRPYVLRPEVGLVRWQASSDTPPLEAEQWIGLQAALISGHLPALQAACEPGRSALRLTLRSLLAYHLEGVPLRTRELMQGLRRLGTARVEGPSTGSSP